MVIIKKGEFQKMKRKIRQRIVNPFLVAGLCLIGHQSLNVYAFNQLDMNEGTKSSDSSIDVEGRVETVVVSLTVPTDPLEFVLNPNLPDGQQFVTSDFEVTNNSPLPLALELKTFEQTTNALRDVTPDTYVDWGGLNKEESKDFALALVPKSGDGWLTLHEGSRWVADLNNKELGSIKGESTVSFGFEAKHGTSFTETLNLTYKISFVFALQS